MTNNYFKPYVLAAVVALCSAPAAHAQEEAGTPLPGDLDFLEVRNAKVFTSFIMEDGTPKEWTGEGYHAGIQVFTFLCTNGKDIPKDFAVPANPTSYVTVRDLSGNVVAGDSKDETQTFRKLKYSKNFKYSPAISVGVFRGGEYKFTGGLSPELYTFEQDIVLPDEPGAQVSGSVVSVEDGLSPLVTITSGYPYDPQAVAGEHSLHWSVVAANAPGEVIIDETETFTLSSEIATLAAIDELHLTVPDAEPGEYIFTLTSDYSPANRTFTAKVNDVLKADVVLDKSAFVFGEDKDATLSVDLSYGYPYIALDDATGEHTVTVTTTLLGTSTSNKFSNPAWGESEMQLTKDIKVSFDEVTEDVLAEYDDKLPLDVVVYFNGMAQYSKTFDLMFEHDSAGVESVEANDVHNGAIKFYNLFGQEVNGSYRGIVISSDCTKQLRK